jgi:hypothetical protein
MTERAGDDKVNMLMKLITKLDQGSNRGLSMMIGTGGNNGTVKKGAESSGNGMACHPDGQCPTLSG